MALMQPLANEFEMKEPVLKKRRIGATQMEPQLTIVEENNHPQQSQSQSAGSVASYPDHVTNQVISSLTCPPNLQVAQDYANHKTPSFEVQAYAKLAGQNWTYFVQKLHVIIGRSSEQQEVDIDLGPAKVVSRKHASIEYNSESQQWQLWVRGRNGVKVDRVVYKEGHVTLRSGAVVDIGGVQMMFVLPGQKVELSGVWVEDVEQQQQGHVADTSASHMVSLPHPQMTPTHHQIGHMNSLTDISDISMASHMSMDDFNHSFTSLADRVSPSRGKSVFSVYSGVDHGAHGAHHSPHIAHVQPQQQQHQQMPQQQQMPLPAGNMTSTSYPRGVALISRPQIRNHTNHYSDYDLSLDDAKDIKPPYSYATMITKAILSGDEHMMTLAEIYEWISKHYSFYRHSRTGWQNSIRHNLSLNKAFVKVPRRVDEPGKGMKWQVTPEHKEEFLRKSKGGELVKKRPAGTLTLQRTGSGGGHVGGATGGNMSTFVVAPPPPGGEQICLGTGHGMAPQSAQPSLGGMAGGSGREGRGSIDGVSPNLAHPTPSQGSTSSSTSQGTSSSRSNSTTTNNNGNSGSSSEQASEQQSSTTNNPLSTPRKDQFGGVGFEDFAFTPSPRFKETFTPDRLSNISASRSTVNMGVTAVKTEPGTSSTPSVAGGATTLPTTSATPAPAAPNLSLAPPSAQQQLPSSFMPASSPAPFWRFMQLSSTPVRGGEGFSPVKYSPSREGGSGARGGDADGLGDLQNIDLTRGFKNWQDSPAKVAK
ncbi:Fork-head transcriptional regulator 2 [Yarrowia sp. C11]|nr:Fork-head transcriptional regulator 2 [Yarrowia sp. E02]KAG5373380.1 Fork-head transcriptional regulator 2 [Yarrowia sp. C11]